MPENMKFSVSMCVYGGDRAEWFQAAVESIVDQTLKPDEIVLVVDGPVSEELDKIIRKYENYPLFVVIRLPVNKGHGIAREIGLKRCQYEYIALMDADDISLTYRFEKQMYEFIKHPNVSVIGGCIQEFVGEITNVVGTRRVPADDEKIKEYMKKRCPFNQMTVMFNKKDVAAAGGYLDWYCDEDYYLWLRMAMKGMIFRNCGEILVKVRCGQDMYKRRGGLKYFRSEARLQKFMKDNGVINFSTYCSNVLKRFVLQVMLSSTIRGKVFQMFAREKV